MYISPSQTQQSPTNCSTQPFTSPQGHFIHQPYGVASQNAVACPVATLSTNNNQNCHNNMSNINSANATSVNTLMQQNSYSQVSTSNASSSSNQHTLYLPSGMVISSNAGSTTLNGINTSTGNAINGYFTGTAGGTGTHYVVQQSQTSNSVTQQQTNGGISYQASQQAIIVPGNGQTQQVQQMVQATINGTTVLIPAGSQQYATFVLHPSTSTSNNNSNSSQIVVHHAVPAGSAQHHVAPQQSQQVYVQYNGTSTPQVLNNFPPGTNYVTSSGNAL